MGTGADEKLLTARQCETCHFPATRDARAFPEWGMAYAISGRFKVRILVYLIRYLKNMSRLFSV